MEKTLTFTNAYHLGELYRNEQKNLDLAEKSFGVKITTRDDWMTFHGEEKNVEIASKFFETISKAKTQGLRAGQRDFEFLLGRASSGHIDEVVQIFEDPIVLHLKRKSLVPKNINQKYYLKFIKKNDVVFGIGPAGTGKTYLAVACALHSLYEREVEKIILTRPAVEAGEALGFLPGDLQEKLLPYLRPLYDAMYDMIGPEETARLMEKQIVEIAPLAYMRGRTLSNAYIILDEAQNTTTEQMMMFLTRLGENSRMIITGDITQIDLPKNKTSGLKRATQIFNDIDGIKLFYFDKTDVVRHPLVTKIIEAYEASHKHQEY